jgi:MEMO1 family protein
MVRKPIVSGQFYPANPDRLESTIKDCFLSDFGPKSLPKKTKDKRLIGIISPHAGYTFSGPAAACAYKEIAEASHPDLFIMLGLSHSGFPTCISIQDWETPLGLIKTDKEFQDALSEFLPVDEEAHASEHSIEVQLPFLQYIEKDPKIAPIIASPDLDYRKIATFIVNTIKSTKRKVTVITSSDFTHYGLNYGYIPFKDKVKENLYSLDKGAIRCIESLQPREFLQYVQKNGATICGQYPIAVLLEISKQLKAKEAALLKYYTSADIIGDYSSAVGYAAIKIF